MAQISSDKQTRVPTAIELASRQREISVSEFFLKNRHLLGFDTPAKALVTAVKEAVDNALDACEEAGVLPEIVVHVRDRLGKARVVVEDNGPGIVESQIARIFGKLLYGSKFHKLSQSRGQQGMGISAAGMYGQLTVGKPLHIISRTEGDELASELYVSIDTANNRPDIHKKRRVEWDCPHGTRVEMEMEGHHQTGPHSVEVYLKQTAIANPHVSITYVDPHGKETQFLRCADTLPPRPKEIKPHPHSVELGRLIQMLSNTTSRSLMRFLVDEFSCVGKKTAIEIIKRAGKPLTDRSYPAHIAHAQAAALHRAIQKTRVLAPRTDCIVPIGEPQLLEGLRKELAADFYTTATRPAAAYRGNPFQVEVGMAFGRPGEPDIEVDAGGHMRRKQKAQHASTVEQLIAPKDEPVRLLRFANRTPLLYQQSSCAITKAVIQTNWRTYGLHQTKGSLPIAPMAILVHVASVWIPYTSESKEAIEPYPEILKEIKLGLQQCARRLAHYLRRELHLRQEYDRRAHIERYLPHIGAALQDILALSDDERDSTVNMLDDVLHTSRTTRRSKP
ncbi:DNA topoisomerase VI subunit B [Methylocystis suflitae]|uniref:DNA topoisomerase VI subunit B n=1 Tax=Methylocystis suflitae TaxID=2951405 RepID=UPI00210B32A4|nr:DNA topoisomerase VI subunit B [Methylocystis suflitae]MCQ4191460.1 DNA topoisomerase VI subunit B [Methylocystis suflitae]